MNTPPLPAVGSKSHPTGNLPNRKESLLEKSQGMENREVTPKRAKSANRAELMSSLKTPGKTTSLDDTYGKDSPEINEYLKMISRFENKVKKDEVGEEDLNKILQALEERIVSLEEQDKTKLKNLEFFKQHHIENLKTMRETLAEMFNDELERETFFEFLKSPEFISILLSQEEKMTAYAPPRSGVNTMTRSEAESALEVNPALEPKSSINARASIDSNRKSTSL